MTCQVQGEEEGLGKRRGFLRLNNEALWTDARPASVWMQKLPSVERHIIVSSFTEFGPMLQTDVSYPADNNGTRADRS